MFRRPDPWGYLVPCSLKDRPVELFDSRVTVGRDPECTVQCNGIRLGIDQEMVSRVHFNLLLDHSRVYLRDVSRYGTFVNGHKVGFNNQIHLQHGAKIGVAHKKAYVFMETRVSDNSNIAPLIKEKYVVGNKLGEGGFGQVYLVVHKKKLIQQAMKIVQKTSIAEREVQILREVGHPLIITGTGYLISSNHIYLLLEYVPGGNMTRWINEKKPLNEKQMKLLIYQIIVAVDYLHDKNITHRDLKPENILVVTENPCTLIKVTDFGIAKDENLHSVLRTGIGTPLYIAPEVLMRRPYTKKVDVWSIGVMLFYGLTGILPFSNPMQALHGDHNIFRNIRWRGVSHDAISTVMRMLVTSPEGRADIKEIRSKSWFQDQAMKGVIHSLVKSSSPKPKHDLQVRKHDQAFPEFRFGMRKKRFCCSHHKKMFFEQNRLSNSPSSSDSEDSSD